MIKGQYNLSFAIEADKNARYCFAVQPSWSLLISAVVANFRLSTFIGLLYWVPVRPYKGVPGS